MPHIWTMPLVVDADVTATTSFPVSTDFPFIDSGSPFRSEEGVSPGRSSDYSGTGETYLEYGTERVRLRHCSQLWADFLRTVQEIESDVMGRFGAVLGARRP